MLLLAELETSYQVPRGKREKRGELQGVKKGIGVYNECFGY
jgi:hypothetical protein